MKKEKDEYRQTIPDLEIIDLEEVADSDDISNYDEGTNDKGALSSDQPDSKRGIFRINLHIVLLVVFVVLVCGIAYKIMNFGQFISQEDIFKDGQGTYTDTLDDILPLIDSNGHRVETDSKDELTIVAFGNAPFADDRDSKDNLANMIEEMTGATVYNCSVSESYLASAFANISELNAPMDVYTFYWLSLLATGNNVMQSYETANELLGEECPPEAEEVINILTTLDFNTVDVITILYDASDYLYGQSIINPENSTDVATFTGNLEAGIEVFQNLYPHIRIIVLSPPYAYSDQLDENGDYISSDIAKYAEQNVLSSYVILESVSCSARNVTFVDNLYGTITEDNAKKYLADNDNLHLNAEGRREIAKRFVYALNFYNKDEAEND